MTYKLTNASPPKSYTLQWARHSPKSAPSSWGLGTQPIYSMVPWVHPTQHPKRHLGSTVFAQLTAERPYSLQWAAPFPPKLSLSMGWLLIWTPIYYMVLWTHPSPKLKRHPDRFIRFAALMPVTDSPTTVPTDRQTDRPRSVTVGRTYVRSTAMRHRKGMDNMKWNFSNDYTLDNKQLIRFCSDLSFVE